MSVSDNFVGLIQRINDSFIRDNIYMVDRSLIAKALKNVAPEHQDKVLRNMTSDGAEAVKNMMAGLDGITPGEIEAAQQEIVSLASQVI